MMTTAGRASLRRQVQELGPAVVVEASARSVREVDFAQATLRRARFTAPDVLALLDPFDIVIA